MKAAVFCAATGAVLAWSLLAVTLKHELWQLEPLIVLTVSTVALFVYSTLGAVVASSIRRATVVGALVIGVMFAEGALLFSVVCGGSCAMIMSPDESHWFDFIVKPLYWVGMFGAVPAAVIGVVFALLARTRTRSSRGL